MENFIKPRLKMLDQLTAEALIKAQGPNTLGVTLKTPYGILYGFTSGTDALPWIVVSSLDVKKLLTSNEKSKNMFPENFINEMNIELLKD